MLLVGAGETIELVARHLREHHVRKMVIANRTRERARALEEVGAEVIALSDIDERLKEADIIISSTASPLPIIGKGMVERALRRAVTSRCCWWISPSRATLNQRSANWLTPTSTASTICKTLFSITAQRKAAAVQAESIVEQETSEFMAAACAERQRDHSRIPFSV